MACTIVQVRAAGWGDACAGEAIRDGLETIEMCSINVELLNRTGSFKDGMDRAAQPCSGCEYKDIDVTRFGQKPLQNPPEIVSRNGVLKPSLIVQYTAHHISKTAMGLRKALSSPVPPDLVGSTRDLEMVKETRAVRCARSTIALQRRATWPQGKGEIGALECHDNPQGRATLLKTTSITVRPRLVTYME
jgi:hypothetical protein